MRNLLTLSIFTLGIIGGVARADATYGGDDHVEVRPVKVTYCPIHGPVRGKICLGAANTETRLLAPAFVAEASGDKAGGDNMWRFARVHSDGKLANVTDDTGWALAMNAELARPATGNVLVLLYDDSNPKAEAKHQVAAVYELQIPSTNELAAVLHFSPVDGVAAGHTYKLRVVQQVRGNEVVLAKTKVTLL